eukprot:scaffold5405_cov229-Prasinococcus_capsulatus_cf.AAC.1
MRGPSTKGAQEARHASMSLAIQPALASSPVASARRVVRPPRPGLGRVRKAGLTLPWAAPKSRPS